MKQLLITIAAVVFVGCEANAPKGSVHIYAREGDIAAVKQHLAAGTDVNATGRTYQTPLDSALEASRNKEIADLLRKHGGKTGEELKAAGN